MAELEQIPGGLIGCCVTLILLPYLILCAILYGIYRLIKYLIKYLVENIKKQIAENKRKQKILDDILSKCKQNGIPEDIENLKNLVEQNIETNGSDIEFLELIFAIAKIYNAKAETEKANEYFGKVKNIISHLKYKDICLLAKKSMDNKNFRDAIFFYTYIILYNKADNKEISEIYYNRAIAYQGLHQVFYKKSAIGDLELAISKSNEIFKKLSKIEAESFRVSKLDKYNYAIAEIYREWNEYQKAIKYYNQVLKNSNMYNEARAQANYLKGEYEEANKYINRALKYSSENEEYLNLKNEIETELSSIIQEQENKRQEQENKKFAELFYKEALLLYKSNNYAGADKNITESIKLFSTDKYINLQKRINKAVENCDIADNLYKEAMNLINTGTTIDNYENAIKMFEKIKRINVAKTEICNTEINNTKNYIHIQELLDLKNLTEAKSIIKTLILENNNNKKLEILNKNIENLYTEAENFYNDAQKFFKEDNFEQAKICIKSALDIDNHHKYKELLNKIDIESTSEKHYNSYLKKVNKKQYTDALSSINKALKKNPQNVKYKNALDDIVSLAANEYFQDGQKFLEQKNYIEAINSFNNAIALDSGNLSYYEQLEIATNNNNEQIAETFYKSSLLNLGNGYFDYAITEIQKALEIYPNKEEYNEILEKANNRIVDIKTCTKNAILTVDGFDKEKAEQFINDRKYMNWYDLESFAKHFNLQPHEIIMLEGRLIFPLKPQVKKGRSVDV